MSNLVSLIIGQDPDKLDTIGKWLIFIIHEGDWDIYTSVRGKLGLVIWAMPAECHW